MNQDIAIKVQNLDKIYKLYDAPIDRLKEALDPRKKKYHKDFYALNDISFEVKKGETVGVIGKNGSGKSTLLKIITGVLTPSSGIVKVNGKVAALLELGAGFNLDYTGIENIYFQGNLMGFTKEQMDEKLQSILEFADIGEFVYQCVKMYSSGMFARLAFAVAINVEPDILIVDEALSVGDMIFQAKCMTKMTSMMKQGVTVLFVSHDIHSVKTLCTKAVFLSDGAVECFGDAGIVANKYIEMQHTVMGNELKQVNIKEESSTIPNNLINTIPIVVSTIEQPIDQALSQRYGDGRATILDAVILDETLKPVHELITNRDYHIQIAIRFNADLPTFVCGTMIASLDGVQQIGCLNSQDGIDFPAVKKDDIYIVTIKLPVSIKAGAYTLTVAVELPTITNEQHQMLDIINRQQVLKIDYETPQKKFYSTFYCKGVYGLNKIMTNITL